MSVYLISGQRYSIRVNWRKINAHLRQICSYHFRINAYTRPRVYALSFRNLRFEFRDGLAEMPTTDRSFNESFKNLLKKLDKYHILIIKNNQLK